MIHAEAVDEQFVLQVDHVEISVVRKLRAQAVAGFARTSMTDIVGNDDEPAVGIERLAGAEELAGKPFGQEIVSSAVGPVQKQHRVIHTAGGIPSGLSDGEVANPEFRQDVTRGKMKVPEHGITMDRLRIGCGLRRRHKDE